MESGLCPRNHILIIVHYFLVQIHYTPTPPRSDGKTFSDNGTWRSGWEPFSRPLLGLWVLQSAGNHSLCCLVFPVVLFVSVKPGCPVVMMSLRFLSDSFWTDLSDWSTSWAGVLHSWTMRILWMWDVFTFPLWVVATFSFRSPADRSTLRHLPKWQIKEEIFSSTNEELFLLLVMVHHHCDWLKKNVVTDF